MAEEQHSYSIEALVEDRSGGLIIAGLLEKILAAYHFPNGKAQWRLAIRPHRGVGSLPKNLAAKPDRFTSNLLGLLPAKLRAYNKLPPGQGADVILLILDSDEKDSKKLFNEVRYVAREIAPRKSVIIGLAVEELEAWLLGDHQAILAAYPEAEMKVLEQYEQDSICGTWEVLARAVMGNKAQALIETGYPAVGMYKAEWAAKISPFLEPALNVSPSFKRFNKALTFVLSHPETILERSIEENEQNHRAKS